MTLEIIEVPRINFGLQKFLNITIKVVKIRFGQTFEAMQHKGFYLTRPMKMKNIKKVPGSNRSNSTVGNAAVGIDIRHTSVDSFFF